MESLESSSPIITRAVAAGLRGEYSEAYQLPSWQKAGLEVLGVLPQAVAQLVIPPFQVSGAHRQRDVEKQLDNLPQALISDRLNDYNSPLLLGEGTGVRAGRFPAVTVGAALGGATAHLTLALGGPFLPQAFVLTLKGGSPDGNVQTYFKRSHALALEIARRHPNLLTIQHYDPVHDNWLTRRLNHLRLKLLNLPPAYADFLRGRLEPGGAVCYLDCGAQWQRYRVGERSVFQVGGWGGLSPEEFIAGSERVRKFARAEKMRHDDWRLDGFPLEQGPESEWGSEPGLAESLEAFCQREGFRFVRISLPEPHDYSRLAFNAVKRLLEMEGRQPTGTLVETFTQFDATAVMQTGLLPLWLVFNTRDSLEFLRTMMPHLPKRNLLFFSPLSTFSRTPDLVPFDDWVRAIRLFEWVNIGARRSHYPADARALVRWTDHLRDWCSRKTQPIQARLSAEALKALAEFAV